MTVLMDILEQYVEDVADTIKKQKYIVDFVNTYSELTTKYDVTNPEKLTISTGDNVRVMMDENNNNDIIDYVLVKDSDGNYKFEKNSSSINYASSGNMGGVKIYSSGSSNIDELLLRIDENNVGYADTTEVLGDLDKLDLVSSFNNGYNA